MAFYKKQKKLELSPRLKFGVGRGFSQNRFLKFFSVIFLVVAALLALNAFRLVFDEENPQNQPEVLGAEDIKDENGVKEAQYIEYQVVAGDTLFSISQEFGISWTTLATLNNLNAPFSLKPGQILKIPK